MKKTLLALSGAAIAATAFAGASVGQAKNYVCTKWDNGVCLSMHRVKGTPPYKVGYAFGQTYVYTPYSSLPQPVVTYYKLTDTDRYVYSNGYIYVVDPTTYAITRVIDTLSH